LANRQNLLPFGAEKLGYFVQRKFVFVQITQNKLQGIESSDFLDINLISVLLFRTWNFANSLFADDRDLKIADI